MINNNNGNGNFVKFVLLSHRDDQHEIINVESIVTPSNFKFKSLILLWLQYLLALPRHLLRILIYMCPEPVRNLSLDLKCYSYTGRSTIIEENLSKIHTSSKANKGFLVKRGRL